MGTMSRIAKRRVFVAGVGAIPLRETQATAMDLHLSVAVSALADANLGPDSIDGILTGVPKGSRGAFANSVAERLGFKKLKMARTTDVGGASPGAMVHDAVRMLRAGVCQTIMVIYADNRFTRLRSGVRGSDAPEVHPVFEAPLDPLIASMYALVARRYLFDRQLPPNALAPIAVAARHRASQTADAARPQRITVNDVLESDVISSPIRKYECCIVGDFAGALVLTSSTALSHQSSHPVEVIGAAEGHSHDHLVASADPLKTAASWSASKALEDAGLTAETIASAQVYDSFTITLALCLEEIGLTAQGSGPEIAAIDSPLPVNTNGGMLAYQNGGIFHLIEAVTQLRGEGGDRQLRSPGPSLVHGVGGILSHHSTVILDRD